MRARHVGHRRWQAYESIILQIELNQRRYGANFLWKLGDSIVGEEETLQWEKSNR